jgi:hypothetical protein
MIKLDSTQISLILTNLDENRELSCIKAFKVAKLIGVKPNNIAQITKDMNIKITNCELGVFGKLKFTDINEDIYNTLKTGCHNNKEIQCEIAWKLSKNKNIPLKEVGSTIKNSDLRVTKCQLGYFNNEEENGFIKATD